MRPKNKGKPTFLLEDVKRLVELEKVSITKSCIKTATEIGFSKTEILDVLARLERKDFVHSVSQHNNPKLWQDVYSKTVNEIRLYIKFQIKVTGEEVAFVLSFKEFIDLDGV